MTSTRPGLEKKFGPTQRDAAETHEDVLAMRAGPHPYPAAVDVCRWRELAPEHRDELGALPLREAADRPLPEIRALDQDLVDLHAAVLRDGAGSMSKTFAVSTYSGGSEEIMDASSAPALRSRLSWRAGSGSRSRAGGPPSAGRGNALVRPRRAWSASSSLAAWAASLHPYAACDKTRNRRNSAGPLVEVQPYGRSLYSNGVTSQDFLQALCAIDLALVN